MARYALVIGIAKYKNFSNLPNPAKDAEAIARLLEKHGDFQEVKRLPANWIQEERRWEVTPNGLLTGDELSEELNKFLLEQAKDNEALIYFAGHGLEVPSRLGRNKQEGYLATSDCSRDGSKGIPLDELNELIYESQLSNLVMLLDCCHAGYAIEKNVVKSTLTAFGKGRNYCLITACRRFEKALEGKEHGVFTGAVLKGLAAENADENGEISGHSLFHLIASELKHKGQEPVYMGWGRSITLVQYPPKQKEKIVKEDCPYQGLTYFGEKEKDFFFGREKVIQLLLKKLEEGNFVPIIGASGSGKSSVVRAGLIPKLKENDWELLTKEPILPGVEPLAKLKLAFIQQFDNSREQDEIYSLMQTAGLPAVIERLPGAKRLLLVVDQFEEVFTLRSLDKDEQTRQFIELLTKVADIPDSRLAIVTTMRADFLEYCLSYESLTELIQNQAVYMPPLLGAELEEAIVKPANLQGYHLETGLLGAILNDVGKEKHCLPLLQFALTELWQKRDKQKHQLTLKQYQDLEGVTGALNRHAENVYIYKDFQKDLPQLQRTAEEQEWIKRIFLRLVRTVEGEKDTRQRQPKAKLLGIAKNNLGDDQVINNVLEDLIRERLLVGEKEIDLAHEALIEGWQRFVDWCRESREKRRLIDRINDACREWEKQPNEHNLMMGGLLAQAREKWLELESDLEANVSTFYQQSNTHEQNRIVESKLLQKAERIQNILPVQPLDGLVLAIQLIGENLEKLPQKILIPVKTSLYKAIKPVKLSNPYWHSDSVLSVAFSPDGQTIASGCRDNRLRLWDISGDLMDLSDDLIAEMYHGENNHVLSIAFSPDGQTIVSGSRDKTLRLWDISGQPIGEPFVGHEDYVLSVAFSPDGQKMVSGSSDKTVRLWDISGNLIAEPFRGHNDSVPSIAFSPDGQTIVSGSRDKTVRLWDISGQPIGEPFQGHNDSVRSVAFSPDGKTIVSGSRDKTVRLWDISGQPIGEPLWGHNDSVSSIAFSPDGKTIVSGSRDKTLRLWDISGQPIGEPLSGHKDYVLSVAFSPDGELIVSGSWDKTLWLWPGSWQKWLEIGCNNLRYEPIFKNPQTEKAKAACEVCQKYVWSKNNPVQ